MFYYVQGQVAALEQNLAVIDCGGVGFAVRTGNITLGQLKIGSTAKLYTYLHVREDTFELYGFATQSELNCFKLLIGVSGVGPKVALGILSVVSARNVTLSIVTGDEKSLTAAPGVGKKMAQRIILELKGKIDKEQAEDMTDVDSLYIRSAAENPDALQEATAALSALGYNPAEINAALKGLDIKTMGAQELIKAALKNTLKL